MLEWADGGNLRKFWETVGIDGTDLDRDRIIDVLEQLVGLAGGLSRLVRINFSEYISKSLTSLELCCSLTHKTSISTPKT